MTMKKTSTKTSMLTLKLVVCTWIFLYSNTHCYYNIHLIFIQSYSPLAVVSFLTVTLVCRWIQNNQKQPAIRPHNGQPRS